MNKQKVFGLTFSALALSMSVSTLSAAELDISITNATKGIYFTPILVAAHDSSLFMFRTGEAASAELEAMAEGGDISGLSSVITNAGGVVSENPASGILNPGVTASLTIDTGDLKYLSLSAMLLPTNDGFVGLIVGKFQIKPVPIKFHSMATMQVQKRMMNLLEVCQTLHSSHSVVAVLV